MRRRDLITVSLTAEEERPTPLTFDMTTVGLPVISDDRVRNYIFVRFRLHLANGNDPLVVREKDPHLRDSIVRAAHRRPFTLEDDWNRLNDRVVIAATMAAARVVAGDGVIASVEVLNQAPRRRSGMRTN